MGKIITNPKTYSGEELSTIFFRPMLSGAGAESLGIRVLYNMPVPTTVGFWRGKENILTAYSRGWQGDMASTKFQKTIDMKKVKAEMSYAASDYFSMVYEKMACGPDLNLGDLSGSELEAAETELFKQSITEGIRATMWVGSTARVNGKYTTFNGLLSRIVADSGSAGEDIQKVAMLPMTTEGNAEKLFTSLYKASDARLRALKSDGNLVILATREVVENYENSLYTGNFDSARAAKISGIGQLTFRGIPVVDMQVDSYLAEAGDLPTGFAILTDRRNLALAVNTRDLPGSEVAMWYNPDELENRQRAVFLAGTDYLLPELIVASFSDIA